MWSREVGIQVLMARVRRLLDERGIGYSEVELENHVEKCWWEEGSVAHPKRVAGEFVKLMRDERPEDVDYLPAEAFKVKENGEEEL